jgi:hypothetical protein
MRAPMRRLRSFGAEAVSRPPCARTRSSRSRVRPWGRVGEPRQETRRAAAGVKRPSSETATARSRSRASWNLEPEERLRRERQEGATRLDDAARGGAGGDGRRRLPCPGGGRPTAAANRRALGGPRADIAVRRWRSDLREHPGSMAPRPRSPGGASWRREALCIGVPSQGTHHPLDARSNPGAPRPISLDRSIKPDRARARAFASHEKHDKHVETRARAPRVLRALGAVNPSPSKRQGRAPPRRSSTA